MSQSTPCSLKICDSEITPKTILFSFCYYKIKYIIMQIKYMVLNYMFKSNNSSIQNCLEQYFVPFLCFFLIEKKLSRLVDIAVQFCAPFGQFSVRFKSLAASVSTNIVAYFKLVCAEMETYSMLKHNPSVPKRKNFARL